MGGDTDDRRFKNDDKNDNFDISRLSRIERIDEAKNYRINQRNDYNSRRYYKYKCKYKYSTSCVQYENEYEYNGVIAANEETTE